MKRIYISSNGSDLNDGLSFAKQIKTLKRLLEIVEQGDEILVEGGSIFKNEVIYDLEKGYFVQGDADYSWDTSSKIFFNYKDCMDGCTITMNEYNSQLNKKPIFDASVEIDTTKLVNDGELKTFSVQHRHNKNVYASSAADDAFAQMWLNGELLERVETKDLCIATHNSYYVENIVEPSGNVFGVCKYYFNTTAEIEKVECSFFSIILWNQTPNTGVTNCVSLKNIVLRGAAGKDGSHLEGGVCDGVEFVDMSEHSALKSYTMMKNCRSVGGAYPFHAFTATKETEMHYENCIAEKGRSAAFFTHANQNNQILWYKDVKIKDCYRAFNLGDAKKVCIDGAIIENCRYVYTSYNGTGIADYSCESILKNIVSFGDVAGYVMDGSLSRAISGDNILLSNCALHIGNIYTNNQSHKCEIKNSTILSQAYFDKIHSFAGQKVLKNSIFAYMPEVVSTEGNENYPFIFRDRFDVKNCYFYNFYAFVNGEIVLPNELGNGCSGNLKIERKQLLFKTLPFENIGAITSSDARYKKGVINHAIPFEYFGNTTTYYINLNKKLVYINAGSGRKVCLNIYVKTSDGYMVFSNTYGSQYGYHFQAVNMQSFDGTKLTDTSKGILTGINYTSVVDWEKGLVKISHDLSQLAGEYEVYMDVVYDDAPKGIFVENPTFRGDYKLIDGCEPYKMGIGYRTNALGE